MAEIDRRIKLDCAEPGKCWSKGGNPFCQIAIHLLDDTSANRCREVVKEEEKDLEKQTGQPTKIETGMRGIVITSGKKMRVIKDGHKEDFTLQS